MRTTIQHPTPSTTPIVESGIPYRIMSAVGRGVVRNPLRVTAAWALLVVTVAALVMAIGRPMDEDVSLPGSDAQRGRELIESYFPGADNASGNVILRAASGRIDDPVYQDALAEIVTAVESLDHVTGVRQPSAASGSLSEDGTIGYLTVTFDLTGRQVTREIADQVLAEASPATDAGLDVLPGGALAREDTDNHRSELLGLAVALIVLVVAFGGLVAAALPLVTALTTVVCGVGAVGLAGHLTSVPSVATTLATMIGLGVGVDYALFLVTRYRRLLADGWDHDEAIVASVASSGCAVLFAGCTVVVALSGLAAAGVPILTTLGWTSGLVVLVAVASATTLLPALLAVLGPRIEALTLPRAGRESRGRSRPADGSRPPSIWARLADHVTARPWRYALGSTVLLLALAVPTTQLEFGQLDAGDYPSGSSSRAGYDALVEGFGPGVAGPLTIVGEFDSPLTDSADQRLTRLVATIADTEGVSRVGAVRLSDDGLLCSVTAVPTTAPSDPATQDTVEAVLAMPVTGVTVHVTGQTAIRGALSDRVTERMPLVIGVVVLLSSLIIVMAFRAPVLAVKAAAMNLFSVTAAYGVLTAVFQWGWAIRLTGLEEGVPIESFVPMMLFALLFGLSMDYEVFLLTAVRESWLGGADSRRAVRDGVASSGTVITSAALIMVCVFVSFVQSDSPVVKMMGLGMASAIAVDATLIRGVLVPSTMALLGTASWWTPFRGRGGAGESAAVHAPSDRVSRV